MNPGTAALIAAAGAGLRLGSGPKALLRLGGQTLLERAVAAVTGTVDEIVVALSEDQLAAHAEALPAVRVVAGGRTRQESVRAMLAASSRELVVVHDVARPFLFGDVLRRVIAAASAHGAATAAVVVADTVVSVENEGYGAVVDREGLRAIQTPQAFQRELLVAAHDAAAAAGTAATDDAGLVRAIGHRVELVEGSRLLFKITERADLLLAEALLTKLAGEPGSTA